MFSGYVLNTMFYKMIQQKFIITATTTTNATTATTSTTILSAVEEWGDFETPKNKFTQSTYNFLFYSVDC